MGRGRCSGASLSPRTTSFWTLTPAYFPVESLSSTKQMGRLDRLSSPISQPPPPLSPLICSPCRQSAKQAVIYNLTFSPSLSVSPIEHTLHAHTRAVTDINWSPGSPDVLATCALDGWVYSWDLRTGHGAGGGRKPVWGVCSWGGESCVGKIADGVGADSFLARSAPSQLERRRSSGTEGKRM
jgi:WD40 repeat protein